jgi:16S rRNA (guanine(966)-N(2))-methyltransferase RsmD
MVMTPRKRDAGKLRVIGGAFRGRKLYVPPGELVRPTADKVREALYDILGERVLGAMFLDACAGTGAVGIEALSRGAAGVTFVEQNRAIAIHLRRNIELVDSGYTMSRVIVGELAEAIPMLEAENRRFDIIYLDPPYAGGGLASAIRTISAADVMSPGTMLIAEHESQSRPPGAEGLAAVRTVVYGRTALSFFAR